MKKIHLIAVIILIFIIGLGIIFSQFYLSVSSSPHKTLFQVKKGNGLNEIATNLEREKLIRSKYLFALYLMLQGKSKELKAGNYLLSPSMTIAQIAKQLIAGKEIITRITIPEGWNLNDIANYFSKQGICQKDEFFKIVGQPAIISKPEDFSSQFPILKDKPKNVSLEGYLFPDTYLIAKSSNCEEVIKLFLKNFSKKLTPQLQKEILRQHKTIFEVITMASLLEKEAKTKQDKALIAGILWKRLKYGIPLQVDATIHYVTGKKSIQISLKETKFNSPYNTYRHLGLPLGPICNPGMESILAAIYPQPSNFWYYLSTPQGKIIFSKTLREHNIKKVKYLK